MNDDEGNYAGLVAVNDVVDPRFHHMFKHRTFNHMQSAILEQALKGDCNMVVAAPTGSGKTVIHELAIIKLISQNSKKATKTVYVAPNKALCQQKLKEWEEKFSRVGLVVLEVTGDIDLKQCMRFVAMANIIITTPEKWDSLTRVWKDHVFLLGAVDLLLIDEVHHLGEDRGATLETLVVRMKMLSNVYIERIRQNNSSAEPPTPMRIIALSATLPNLVDIGEWLGCAQDSIHYFDESYRPVPLTVHTLSMGSMNNAFLFDKSLDERVGPLVQRYCDGKQVLIFCASKKSCETLCVLLTQRLSIPRECLNLARQHAHLIESTHDISLRALLHKGVAYHHSGLPPDHRALVEHLYLSGAVHILCCTSTLAHGVNLPAHLVIVKGTSSWRGGSRGYERTAKSDVIQMLGRAGRPGMDDQGVAVIMTSREDQDFYADVSLNAEIVESKLQKNLVEAICAEITQTVIINVETCIQWMRNTFFYIRVRKSPAKYGFEAIGDLGQLNTLLATICLAAIQDLASTGLVEYHASSQSITPLPEATIMTRNLIKFPTMQTLVQIPALSNMPQLLRAVCQSPELHKPLRRLEKSHLNECMKLARYPLKTRVTEPWHKSYVLLLSAIARTEHKDFTLRVEQAEVVEASLRVLYALRELCVQRCLGTLLEHACLLDRALRVRLWEHGYSSVYLQCTALTPTTRNSLTLRNVRTIGDVVGCSLGKVQDMCGGSVAEARAILSLAHTLQQASLEVSARVVYDKLDIQITSSHSTSTNTTANHTIPVDSNYPSYILLAYNVLTGRALCIRNLDRGTRSIQYSVDIDPSNTTNSTTNSTINTTIEHIKCCLLCTNYVGIDSYQQATVVQDSGSGTAPDILLHDTTTTTTGTSPATTSTTRRSTNNTQTTNTASPTTASTTHTNNIVSSTTKKSSPTLKQTTLPRFTTVVDSQPYAGLQGTSHGVRVNTSTKSKDCSAASNNVESRVYGGVSSRSTLGGDSSVGSGGKVERVAVGNSGNAMYPPSYNTTTNLPQTNPSTHNTRHTSTTNPTNHTNPHSNAGRFAQYACTNSSALTNSSNNTSHINYDIDDAALGISDDDGELIDTTDYYYPTANTKYSSINTTPSTILPPVLSLPPKPTTKLPTTQSRWYKPLHYNTSNPTNTTHSHTTTVPSTPSADHVSAEVGAMRRKAQELDLLHMPVTRLRTSVTRGTRNIEGSDGAGGVMNSSGGVHAVSPPSYKVTDYDDIVACSQWQDPTMHAPHTNTTHATLHAIPYTTAATTSTTSTPPTNRKRFFDQYADDTPIIPHCEDLHTSTNFTNTHYPTGTVCKTSLLHMGNHLPTHQYPYPYTNNNTNTNTNTNDTTKTASTLHTTAKSVIRDENQTLPNISTTTTDKETSVVSARPSTTDFDSIFF